MKTYETTATVEDNGQMHLAGAPFEAGTPVNVMISRKATSADRVTPPDAEDLSAAREHMRELFRTVKGFRNSPRIPREELYDRGSLH